MPDTSVKNAIFTATGAVSITSNSLTIYDRSRAVYVGTTQSIDLNVTGTATGWITFQGATAGTVIPVQAYGARITAGSASPAAGDVVFLY